VLGQQILTVTPLGSGSATVVKFPTASVVNFFHFEAAYIVNWDPVEPMTEADIEIVLQAARGSRVRHRSLGTAIRRQTLQPDTPKLNQHRLARVQL
jgi:hypothetical protein